MSLLSHDQLVELVQAGVIDAPLENINAASIDITLSKEILTEQVKHFDLRPVVSLKYKQNIQTERMFLPYHLNPDEFILATSRETFNLPNNIAAEYKLKSSLARNGLQHMLAGWCDPGWNGSKLTLEFKNVTRYHTLLLEEGMKIGQMVFWECDPVSDENSYATRGQYNGQTTVTPSKGVR